MLQKMARCALSSGHLIIIERLGHFKMMLEGGQGLAPLIP